MYKIRLTRFSRYPLSHHQRYKYSILRALTEYNGCFFGAIVKRSKYEGKLYKVSNAHMQVNSRRMKTYKSIRDGMSFEEFKRSGGDIGDLIKMLNNGQISVIQNAKGRLKKNAITIAQLKIACRHYEEMLAAGITENLAIRNLELFAELYAKLRVIGTGSPNHVSLIELWSVKALRKARGLRDALTNAGAYFRVEHGTPRRGFARKIFDLYRLNKLTVHTMNALVSRHFKLAVITVEEDEHLNKVARSTMFPTPEKRWEFGGINVLSITSCRSIPKVLAAVGRKAPVLP
jgi:hypothetical protein